MKRTITSVAALLFCVLSDLSFVMAHEGHGHTAVGEGNSAKHYLTEPYHMAQLVGVIALAATLGLLAHRWMSARNAAHKIAA
jgi:hypothetical protein